MLQQFSEESPSRGLYYIFRRKKRKRKLFEKLIWAFITVCTISFCFWQCADCFRQYFSFDTKVKITFKTMSEMEFPAITLCSSNYLRKSTVGRNDQTRYMVAMMSATADDNPNSIVKRVSYNIVFLSMYGTFWHLLLGISSWHITNSASSILVVSI